MGVIIVLEIQSKGNFHNWTENLTQNFLEAKTKLEQKLYNSYLIKIHKYS